MLLEESLIAKDDAQQHLIEYYRAFELLLSRQRERNELRTHFGFLDEVSLTNDYCFFKAISAPDQFPEMTALATYSSNVLHEKLFHHKNWLPAKVLDVGFGSGGTMTRLGSEWVNSDIHGINLNPVQYDIARRKLSHQDNLQFFLGDYLDYPFGDRYDLVYFIESAFHILDKELLVKRIADSLNQGGEAYIVDIFYSDIIKRLFGSKKKVNEEIFDYISVDDWTVLAEKNGLEMISFEDYSQEAANHICIRTDEDEFEELLMNPLLEGITEDKDLMAERIWEAYHGYAKLHKFFKRELLYYGIIRFTKR